MTETDACMLSTHKKRRGVVRASVTHLNTKFSELESSFGGPDNLDIIKCLTTRLDALNTGFKVHHLAIVDLINDEEALQEEQDALDEHDDNLRFEPTHSMYSYCLFNTI